MSYAYKKGRRFYLGYQDVLGRVRQEVSAARTLTEARDMAAKEEARHERIRRGMELAPESVPTLAEALDWWLKTYCLGKPSYAKACSAINLHLMTSAIAHKRLTDITAGDVEALLHDKARALGPMGKPLGAQSLNHLRSYVRLAFVAATKRKLFGGSNPIDDVPLRKLPKRQPDYLRHDEVLPVLRALKPCWLGLFATAIYAGLRKGELFGLRKGDVDLVNRTMTVRRSYDRDTTKGGHDDTIPIAAELIPYLEAAIDESPSDLVFPKPDGTMRALNTQVEKVLRRALARAGICYAYRHKCRATGCKHAEQHPDDTIRRCPTHAHKMWVTSLVRPIRFHDLRHTTGSLLAMQGVDTPALQRILRHRDPRLTMQTYVHLSPNYLRTEIDRLSFGSALPGNADTDVVAVAIAASKLTRHLPPAPINPKPDSTPSGDHQEFQTLAMERDIGFEPTTFSLGS